MRCLFPLGELPIVSRGHVCTMVLRGIAPARPSKRMCTQFNDEGGNAMNVAQRISIDPKVAKYVSKPRKLLIDGKWTDAVSGKTFPVYDPATGNELAHVAEADAADVDKAVRAARKAFDEGPWPRMSPSERGRILWKLADLIEKNAQQFA